MWVFTSVADWIDEQGKSADSVLDQLVEDSHYNHGVMIAAATTHSFMKFGASMSDILRLGDGVKKGGVSGFFADGMRFIAIFPVGKATQMAKSAVLLNRAKVIQDIAPRAGICSWVGTTKALAQTGHQANGKLYAHVADLAAAVGMSIDRLGGVALKTMAHNLQDLGAKIGNLVSVRNLEEILAKGLLKRDGSVVLISVKTMRAGKEVGGHLIYAFYDTFGRLRFMDRTIVLRNQSTYASLGELAIKYGVDEMIPRAALPIYNMFVKSVAYQTPTLVLPIAAVVAQYQEKKPQVAKSPSKK